MICPVVWSWFANYRQRKWTTGIALRKQGVRIPPRFHDEEKAAIAPASAPNLSLLVSGLRAAIAIGLQKATVPKTV